MDFPRTEAHPGTITYITVCGCVYLYCMCVPASMCNVCCYPQARVMATIGVTRGLGDHDLKVYNSNIYIKPFLSCVPEVSFRREKQLWLWALLEESYPHCRFSHLRAHRIHLNSCQTPGFTLLPVARSETLAHCSKCCFIMCFLQAQIWNKETDLSTPVFS